MQIKGLQKKFARDDGRELGGAIGSLSIMIMRRCKWHDPRPQCLGAALSAIFTNYLK
jgi:hypothetical protein